MVSYESSLLKFQVPMALAVIRNLLISSMISPINSGIQTSNGAPHRQVRN